MFSYSIVLCGDLQHYMYLLQHAFPCEESKETGRVVIGWAWEGVVAQTNPGRPLRSGKVTWQTTSCWQKRRATLGLFRKGSGVSTHCPLMQAFLFSLSLVFFCYPSKISCHYRQNFLFKIRSQYTWFSLFWLCTEVQKVTLHHLFLFQSLPHPFSPQRLHSTTPQKWSNMQLVFQHGPISRESKNIETILLSEMDTVENNIFTLNI